MIWKTRNKAFDLTAQGEIMGILNVTPDSFSDGGQHDTLDASLRHAQQMVDEGARIIDVGGESTRPGAAEVDIEEEIRRTAPVIAQLKLTLPDHVAISIDTRKSGVASAAIDAGADIINDVSGLTFDPEMLPLCARSTVGIVIMHMTGTPETMQDHPRYDDVVADVQQFFQNQLQTCIAAGIDPERLVFDPGIGFGKTQQHNLTLLQNLALLAPGDRPILLGVSRKSLIARVLDDQDISRRLAPTVALTAIARRAGVPLHRVHDVRENHDAMRMVEAIPLQG